MITKQERMDQAWKEYKLIKDKAWKEYIRKCKEINKKRKNDRRKNKIL